MREKTQLITKLSLPKHHDILPYIFQMRIIIGHNEELVILIRGRQGHIGL